MGVIITQVSLAVWQYQLLNNRLVSRLEAERALHEGQAGFREKRSCVDNIFTLNEIVQGKMWEGKHTYTFFLESI